MRGVDHLLLIPDSHRKEKGDAATTVPPDACVLRLPADPRRALHALRRQVAAAADFPLATDLVPEGKAKVDLLPAHQRYQGNMYHRIPPESWTAPAKGVEVVILSALYGPIHSREPVRTYSFSMGERLGALGTLHLWWRDHGLPAILSELINTMKPSKVTDLLSGVYRSSVDGYRASVRTSEVEQVDFPGMGRGSQVARGNLIAQVLQG